MRGLLVIEPLYHQIVAGRKTQTRRSGGLDEVNHKPGLWHQINWSDNHVTFEFDSTKLRNPLNNVRVLCKPRYKVGEVLYLKEPFLKLRKKPNDNDFGYKFGCLIKGGMVTRYGHAGTDDPTVNIQFKNKLFMPAAAARAFIRITGIRCERLLDISDEDCIAEGIEIFNDPNDNTTSYKNYEGFASYFWKPKDSFQSLYCFANKVKTVSNLWVWAYSFEYLPNFKPA